MALGPTPMGDPDQRKAAQTGETGGAAPKVRREEAFADTAIGIGAASPAPGDPRPSDPAAVDPAAIPATTPGPARRHEGTVDSNGVPLTTPASAGDGAEESGPDPLVGRVLSGLYKVESRLGEGGMGTVYTATHVHLNKSFAVKVLSRKIATNREAIERLRQEAIAASSIDHDNIVDVINFDVTDDGNVFIVMELLKGKSLADVVDAGPMALDKALPIVLQICRALEAAHERGIIHRDLKPENVHIVQKGEMDFVKVLDFGISKVRSADTEQVRMTKTGQLVGTPLYMSPEQARGEMEVDRRVDVYSLGVMLYEMLTGTPPFEGGNYFQLLWKHGNEEPEPPRVRNPKADIPPALETVILKALAKDPETRWGSMAELEAALLEAAPDVPVPPPLFSMPPGLRRETRAPAPHRSRALLFAGGAVLAIAIVGVVVAATRGTGGDARAIVPTPTHEPKAAPPARQGPQPAGPTASHDPTQLPHGVEPPQAPSVHFDSVPEGAEVHVGERSFGRTPLDAPLPLSATPVDVRFTLRGHADDVVPVIPAEGAQVRGHLRPLRHGSGHGSSNSLHFKTEL